MQFLLAFRWWRRMCGGRWLLSVYGWQRLAAGNTLRRPTEDWSHPCEVCSEGVIPPSNFDDPLGT